MGAQQGRTGPGPAANEGAGLYAQGTVTIVATTVGRNSSGLAGGGKGVTIGDTIFSANSLDVQATLGKFTSAGYNLIGSSSGTTGFGGNGSRRPP